MGLGLILIGLCSTPSLGFGEPIRLGPDTDKVEVGGQLLMLEDQSGNLGFEDVSAPPELARFRVPLARDAPNLGFSSSAYWLQLELLSSDEDRTWVIELGFPLLDHVDMYSRGPGGEIEVVETGDVLPFSERPLDHHTFLFPVRLEQDQPRTFFIRVKTDGTVQLPVTLWRPEVLLGESGTRLVGEGMFNGVLAILALSNLIMLFHFRRSVFFWFVALIVSDALATLSLNGLGFRYLWSNFPAVNSFALPMSVAALQLFSILFTVSFLKVPVKAPRLIRSLRLLGLWCAVLAVLSIVLPYSVVTPTVILTSLLTEIIIVYAGFRAWNLGYRPAGFFLLAWAGLLAGSAMYALRALSVLPTNILTTNSMQFGGVVQMVLFSVALTDSINIIRLKKEEAQRARLEEERRVLATREAFGRYVTPEVVQVLLDSPEAMEPGGRLQEITILMSDLRGFTSLTKRLGPPAMIELLNTYLERMTDVINEHGGTVNEFIGDAILALFGAPRELENPALSAVRCAVAMQIALAELNEEHEAAGNQRLEMGIGVHTGEAIVGNIGSLKRTKWGVVGDPVNMTARIESLTVGSQILVSDDALGLLGPEVELGRRRQVRVKGRIELLEVAEVLAVGDERLPATVVTEMVEVSCRGEVFRLEGKQLESEPSVVDVIRLGPSGLVFEGDAELVDGQDLAIRLAIGEDWTLLIYGKLAQCDEAGSSPGQEEPGIERTARHRHQIDFTSMDPKTRRRICELSKGS